MTSPRLRHFIISFGAYVADPKSSAKLQAKQTNSTSLEQRLEEQRREFEARFKALEVELARLRDGRTTDKTEEVSRPVQGGEDQIELHHVKQV
nr:hypothetical protein CFP56_05372 [Quercus suber]